MYQSENFTECSCISQGCPEKQNQSEIGINFKELPGIIMGFPDSSVDKESACNAGDHSSIPRLGRPAGEGIGYLPQYSWASLVAQLIKYPLAVRETWVWSPGSGGSPGEVKDYPSQYSGLENSMDCIVLGVAKSRTQ